MENGLKKLFLAAVGGTSLTYEKAQEVVDQMIEKGKVSVSEGKELTEDLKRTLKGDKAEKVVSDDSKQMLAEELLALRKDLNNLSKEVAELRELTKNDSSTLMKDKPMHN